MIASIDVIDVVGTVAALDCRVLVSMITDIVIAAARVDEDIATSVEYKFVRRGAVDHNI